MGWTIAFFGIWAGLWWRGATVLKAKGRSFFMRNWIASVMGGLFVGILWTVLFFAGAFAVATPATAIEPAPASAIGND